MLSRLRALGGDIKSSSSKKWHWRLAEALVDKARPGDLNQALMELGALVCTPTNPSCGMTSPVLYELDQEGLSAGVSFFRYS